MSKLNDQFQASGIDPVSGLPVMSNGDMIIAGNYQGNDWSKLSNNNPALATALIQQRQAMSDAANAEQAKRTTDALLLGGIGGAGTVVAVGRDRVNHAIRNTLERYAETLSPEGTYYAGSRVRLFGESPGNVALTIDGQLSDAAPPMPIRELGDARNSFANYTNSPEGKRLYQTVAHDATPEKIARKQQLYEKLGFGAPDKAGVQRMDLRPGARHLKGAYRQGDRLMNAVFEQAGRNPGRLTRGGEIGLGLAAAGAIAGGSRMLMGLINPVEDY